MKLDFVEIGERAGFRLLHLALLVAFFPNFRVRRAHLARAHDSDPRRCQLEQCPSIERSRGAGGFGLVGIEVARGSPPDARFQTAGPLCNSH